MVENKKVLGVDPGLRHTGYAVVENTECLHHGLLRLIKESMPVRLKSIFTTLDRVIKEHGIEELALEGGFVGKNANVAMKLGQARAAVILAAGVNDIPVYQYSPREIKLSVVGYGAADKEQVFYMVSKILNIHPMLDISVSARGRAKGAAKVSEHESDAMATAVCHFNSSRIAEIKERYMLK